MMSRKEEAVGGAAGEVGEGPRMWEVGRQLAGGSAQV